MSEYQFTIKRQIVVTAHVSVEAGNEDEARDLAMRGVFSEVPEEADRLEEFTLEVLSLDAVE